MYPVQIKNQALKLRKGGKSIYEIARVLKLNHTTVSTWCKDILLSQAIRNKIDKNGKLKAKSGMLLYTEKLREQRLAGIKSDMEAGVKMIGTLSERDILMIGIGLYWGEGYKYANSEFGFTNSNLYVIKFYIKWLSLLGVNKEDLICRLTVNNAFRDYSLSIQEFWIKNLGVKESQFSAITFIKTNLKKADVSNLKTYKGILRIKVRKGVRLKNKIMGVFEHIKSCL